MDGAVDGVEGNISSYATNLSMAEMGKAMSKVAKLCRHHKIVLVDGIPHIYFQPLGTWYNLYTSQGLGILVDHLEINAPVNYATACERFFALIKSTSAEVILNKVSTCIADYRLFVTMIGDEVKFSKSIAKWMQSYRCFARGSQPKSRELDAAFSHSKAKRHIPRLCLRSNLVPTKVRTDGVDRITEFLLHMLTEHQLDLLMWVVGHGLIDPVSFPMCLFIHGSRGGEGKSRIIRLLDEVLAGVISPMNTDYFGETKKKVSPEDMDLFMSNRFLYIADAEVPFGKVNGTFLKRYFGGDKISTKLGPICLQSVLIVASNAIWFPHSYQLEPWRLRRMTTLVMDKPYSGPKEQLTMLTDEERLLFVSKCIRMRLENDRPPYDFSDFAHNAFGRMISYSTRGLMLCSDSTDLDAYEATLMMSISTPCPMNKLVDCARSMSPELVTSFHGEECIKGVRIRPEWR